MRTLLFATTAVLFLACSHTNEKKGDEKLRYPGEEHLSNIRQLTFAGTNAEAYWSFDGKWLSFQHKAFEGGPACDQIFVMRANGADLRQLTNEARTTCAYFLPDDERVLFSSTISGGKECPPEPDKTRGYVWPIFNTYQIYSAKLDGTDVRPLDPGAPRAYNAEATVCKDGSVVFTSDRDGDLELYRGKLDSLGTLTEVQRLTFTPGYDGGAFFSPDCTKIVWRASRPKPGKELDEYQALLKQHLVRPGQLEIWVADADGSHPRQVTRIGAASFAPFFTPDGERILFSSNPRDPKGRRFDIYSIGVDGTGFQRITFSNSFDSFPMFSPDGKRLAFSSNRNAARPHETNVFVADWIPAIKHVPSLDDMEGADRVAAWTRALKQAGSDETRFQLISQQAKRLGLSSIIESDGTTPLITSLGRGCTQSAVLMAADVKDPSSAAGLLETAKMLHDPFVSHKSGKKCAVFAWTNASARKHAGNEILATLAARKIRARSAFTLSRIGSLEANSVQFGIPTGQEARAVKKVRLEAEAECVALNLSCSFEDAPGGLGLFTGTIPTFHLAAKSFPNQSETLNATGAMQLAELLAKSAVRTASR
ncbi:MAG: hypothetical protein A2X94_17540 [Bdellovibrionales bacterium GWB1_55_8]|nr:MAG: hypothetical protein A2X94_17540 [Bdellovibrionales bacterium GWB1_55_8]